MDFEIVAKYLLWPAATAVGGYALGRVRHLLRMRTFRRVFGKGITKFDDVIVTLPLWKAIDSGGSIPRFQTSHRGEPRHMHRGPDEMYSRDDVFAAADVLNILANHLETRLGYSDDTEALEWDRKTAIMVGAPVANSHARFYFERHSDERSHEMFPHFRYVERTEGSPSSHSIWDPALQRELRADDEWDYGLVLRVENVLSKRLNRFVFLIAGLNASSTREAGRLFNEQWSKLGKERTPLRRLVEWGSSRFWRKPHPPLGFVFRMARGMPGTGKIEYYI